LHFFCRQVFVGDVVLIKDPEKSNNYIVRRLAAIEGYEMVSSNEEEEPFVLDNDQCWVLSDNTSLKPKVQLLILATITSFVLYVMGNALIFGLVGTSINMQQLKIEVNWKKT
jgi:hypothetical protein